jgi:hypothetical protein
LAYYLNILGILGGSKSSQLQQQWRISRSGGLLPHSRRSFANAVALLVPTAAQSAIKFSTRRRFSHFPPANSATILQF